MSPETLTASAGVQAQEAEEAEKVGVGAYISLFFAMCFFRFSRTMGSTSGFDRHSWALSPLSSY